ncbi:MAG: SIR2 family protein, partial [bacterium]|nr:SIR2 family protein [bacterium]
MSPKKSTDAKLKQLGKSIFDRLEGGHNPYALILGAGASVSSKCPTWPELCKAYCEEYSITVSGSEYISAFKNHLKGQEKNKIDVFLAFSKKLQNIEPSLGYLHLANLISKKAFRTVITTNFDNLLEQALAKLISTDDVKVLIRGEVTDDYIADFIEKGIPKIKIIKLHGDLQSNIFYFQDEDLKALPEALKRALQRVIQAGSVVIGSEVDDPDLMNLYSSEAGHNIFVNPAQPQTHIRALLSLKDNQILSSTLGEFDAFSTEQHVMENGVKNKIADV